MPVSGYYGGHGDKVMDEMRSKYGDKEGERVFYATANKRKQKPGESRPHRAPDGKIVMPAHALGRRFYGELG